MLFVRYLVFLGVFFSSVCLCFISRAQRFPFYNLTVEQGLIQSQATCLDQDKLGNLWVGTLGGISRFDGKKIKNYTVNEGLDANIIVDIKVLPNENILVSSGQALQCFNGTNFYSIALPNGNNKARVSNITLGKNDQVFCLVDGALASLDWQQKRLLLIDTSREYLSLQVVDDVFVLSDTKGGLFQFEPKKSNRVHFWVGSTDVLVLRVFQDSRKRIWLLSNKGLYVLKDGLIKPYQANGQQVVATPLLSAAEDLQGNLWFASVQGAVRLKDSLIDHFVRANGLSDNLVNEIICDLEGNVWMGTDGEGVFRFSGGPFISFDDRFGLPYKQVTSIAGDANGSIFLASYQGGLYAYEFGRGLSVLNTKALNNDIIIGLAHQSDEGLWIATRTKGLFHYLNGKIAPFHHSLLPAQLTNVSCLYVDHTNRLIVGYSGGVLVKDKAQVRVYSQLGFTPIAAIRIKDTILFATRSGLFRLEAESLSPWHTNTLLDSLELQCLVLKGDYLFGGTAEKGILVYQLSNKRIRYINTSKGLSSDFIYNLLVDYRGQLWAGTGRGVCKIQEPESATPIITNYGKENGVIGLESNSGASFEDEQHRIWFGTTAGVSCYFPSANPTLAKPISIVLESVKLFGGKEIDSAYYNRKSGWYGIPEGLRLPFRNNNISFGFQAITLSPVDKILYRYRLEGAHANWSEWSEENSITFSSLASGDYTLTVMCKVNGSLRSEVALRYSFSIKTPFHKSIWFFLSIVLLAISSGVFLNYEANRRRAKRLEHEEKLRKEEQKRVRERTAEDFHDEVGNKLTRINVLTSVLQSKLNERNPDLDRILQQIKDNVQQLYSGTRDILWSLQPSNDNLFEILNHLSDLAIELFSETNVDFSLSGNDDWFKSYKMPLDKSRNFIMICKEALNNCMKYSEAQHVLLQVKMLPNKKIQIRLVDDGKGFDPNNIIAGNGLKNMKARAQRMGAQLEILTAKDKGTQIVLTMPEIK